MILIRNCDAQLLTGFEMVPDRDNLCGTIPQATWDSEKALLFDECELAMVCMLSIGINTLMKDENYCEVFDADINPNN